MRALTELRKLAAPRYRDYLRRYKGPGSPMRKDDWERKVLNKGTKDKVDPKGKPSSGDPTKGEADEGKAKADKKETSKGYSKTYHPAVTSVMDKHSLKDTDANEVRAFKNAKPFTGGRITDGEKLRRFLLKAKPETKERMKSVSPADFVKMLGAILDDEEGGKQASALNHLRDLHTACGCAGSTPDMKDDVVFGEILFDGEMTSNQDDPRMASLRRIARSYAGEGIRWKNRFFQIFFPEKGLPLVWWNLRDNEGTSNQISNQSVLEFLNIAPRNEQQGIERMIRKIDFANGDVNKYLKHLAGALINNPDFAMRLGHNLKKRARVDVQAWKKLRPGDVIQIAARNFAMDVVVQYWGDSGTAMPYAHGMLVASAVQMSKTFWIFPGGNGLLIEATGGQAVPLVSLNPTGDHQSPRHKQGGRVAAPSGPPEEVLGDWEPGHKVKGDPTGDNGEGSDVPDGDGNTTKRAFRTRTTRRKTAVDLYVAVSGDKLFGATDAKTGKDKSSWKTGRVKRVSAFDIVRLKGVPEKLAMKLVDFTAGNPKTSAWSEEKAAFQAVAKYMPKTSKKGAASGNYGFTKGMQKDIDVASRRIAKEALRIAKYAHGKDARVADFFVVHAERGESLTSKVLVTALQEMGPKFAMGNKAARLEELREARGTATTYKEASYGMYGYRSKTSKLGLGACSELKHEAGRIGSNLHRRRHDKHAQINEYLKQHCKEADCNYSRLLQAAYPEADMKFAAIPEPNSIEDWISWEE